MRRKIKGNHQKYHQDISYSTEETNTINREGGRTVGSGRVATVIE